MEPVREQDDPRLSAYLFDELDPEDRAALEAELAGDAELRGELESLRAARAWLGERFDAADSAAPRLGTRARERLRLEARGQAPAAEPAARGPAGESRTTIIEIEDEDEREERRRGARRFMEWALVASLLCVMGGMAVPGFIRARSQSRMRSCQENLTKIDGAKEQWALENNQRPGVPVEVGYIATDRSGYLKEFPLEPAGGSYIINAVGEDPVCTTDFPGHSLSEVGDAITLLES